MRSNQYASQLSAWTSSRGQPGFQEQKEKHVKCELQFKTVRMKREMFRLCDGCLEDFSERDI